MYSATVLSSTIRLSSDEYNVVYKQVLEAEKEMVSAIERKKKTASPSLPLMGLPFKPPVA